ncbi:MAG: glycosyl transferase family 2, partial [Pseudomonadota bacterium]|nr:glycosyl transferase family 2 [Pseudomonadota bacterium]
LDHQIAALDTDSSLAAVGGRAALFTDRGPAPKGMQLYVDWVNNLDDLHREILVESPLLHPAVTFRAAQIEHAGGYRSGEIPEDYDLWLRLVANGLRIANVSHDVVSIRDHSGRLTRTNSRYSRSAFDSCRRNFLEATTLTEPRRVVLWAGMRGGRPWLHWLQSGGHRIIAVIDITKKTTRSGVPVLPPNALPDIELDMLLVAVGARGARDQIRNELAVLRPDLVEGQNWWALL